MAENLDAQSAERGINMAKYTITNTITGEKQSVYSENSKEAKRCVCRANGWNTAECDVRMVSDR